MATYKTVSTEDAMKKLRAAVAKYGRELDKLMAGSPTETTTDVRARFVTMNDRLFERANDPHIRGTVEWRAARALVDEVGDRFERDMAVYAERRKLYHDARASALAAPEPRRMDEATRQYQRELRLGRGR